MLNDMEPRAANGSLPFGHAAAPIADMVRRYLADYFSYRDELDDDLQLVDDLGADSLDVLQVAATLEDRFGIRIDADALPNLMTVGGVCRLIERLVEGRGARDDA
ncbi:acyl carrier protein [Burkholderia ubonensis]|uniref:acyl carrier protein n=1 Tax=Burkholderia ubonensis TaxID=101571 RepID=UPI0009B3C17F|nr:acyl carrier protein [Burkholderia ubonensis]